MTMPHIERHFRVALHIHHPEMKTEEMTSTLSLVPKIDQSVGAPRKGRDGRLLTGTYKKSYWSHSFDLTGVRNLFTYLDQLLDDLKPHKEFFRKIYESDGGKVELFCGIFTGSNWDEVLPVHLAHKLVSLRIDLRLDAYPDTTQPKKPVVQEDKKPAWDLLIKVVSYQGSDPNLPENRLYILGDHACRSVDDLMEKMTQFNRTPYPPRFVIFGTNRDHAPKFLLDELEDLKNRCHKAGMNFHC